MNLMTLIVMACIVSCTFSNEMVEKEYYLERVQRMADLDFGYGNIHDKNNLTSKFKDMTLSDLKVTLVELYTTLECSFMMNIYIHSTLFKSYLLFETKPTLSADEIEMYSFVKEAQRMLTAMHNIEKYSTAKYIMWAYLVYTGKMAKFMRNPENDYSSHEKGMITVAHKSIVKLLTQSILDPLCKHFYFDKIVLTDWPIIKRERVNFNIWTGFLTTTRKTVLKQLDFNDSKGVNSTDDNTYSLDVLYLKGVFDQSGKLNYLIRKWLMHSNWNAVKLKFQGLSNLPENVDFNSLAISLVSFKELQETILTDYYPTLGQQINHLIKFHTNFIQLLKVIPLQLINKYLLTIMNSIPNNSYIDDRIPPILNFNKEIANQLSVFVDILDLKHDEHLSRVVQFFNEISNSGRLSLSVVSNAQNSLNTNLEKIGNLLFDGPVINTIKLEADSISAGSVVLIENGTTEKLRALVNNIKEIIEYVKENITNLLNFKGIHSFIDIEFSEEFSRLQNLEENCEPHFSV